jgi:predicted nucleic acid-binding protein
LAYCELADYSQDALYGAIKCNWRPGRNSLLQKILTGLIIDTGMPDESIYCRDEKDIHLLDLAWKVNANCLVSGDKDLLILNPFGEIPIVSPTEFIFRYAK